MRLLKGFIFTITGLFVFITLLSLLIPSRVQISRGVVIDAPAQKVFAEIANLHNWKHWQPVLKADTGGVHYSADSTAIGSYCEWMSSGKKNKCSISAGGSQSTTVILSREGENDWINTITVLPLADSSKVQVEWSGLTRLKWYPWEKFYGIFIEKVTGPGFEESLNSLKAYVEKH